MTRHHHSSPREGVAAGILGALTVAALFLIRDMLLGVPLLTPSVLGQIVLQGATVPVTDRALTGAVVAYTLVHFVVFIVFVAGVLYAEHLLHVPQTWVLVSGLVLVGAGVMSAVSHTKRRDPPAQTPSP